VVIQEYRGKKERGGERKEEKKREKKLICDFLVLLFIYTRYILDIILGLK
jgi:hypothetical protein